MITHRPVTGSLRSSGIECVLNHADHRLVPVNVNRHDVEPARARAHPPPAHVLHREPGDPPALSRRHGFARRPASRAITRFHLDENENAAISRDDVDFSSPPPPAPGKNCIPAALEFTAGEIFAEYPKGNIAARHSRPGARTASNNRAGG
jgi:hypothetical protein